MPPRHAARRDFFMMLTVFAAAMPSFAVAMMQTDTMPAFSAASADARGAPAAVVRRHEALQITSWHLLLQRDFRFS